MITKIKYKVLFILLGMLLLYVIVLVLNYFYLNKTNKINILNNDIGIVETLFYKDAIEINNFFAYDFGNNVYKNTRYSQYIEQHKIFISRIKFLTNKIKDNYELQLFNLQNKLHELEVNNIEYQKSINNALLINNKHSVYDLKNNINTINNNNLHTISQIRIKSNLLTKKLLYQLKFIMIIITIIFLLIGIFISIILSNNSTRTRIYLSNIIGTFISSNVKDKIQFTFKIENNEIGKLVNSFIILQNKICNQLDFLEENITKRTQQIVLQNKHIKEQNEEISSQRDDVIAKNSLIKKQNLKIIDSIKYAKTIQEAFLPKHEEIAQKFPEHFIFWKPKDIVSGDFYWFKHIKSKNTSIIAASDCTGHGVPGGFMSILGNSLLNEIILRKQNYNPAVILDLMKKRLIETFRTNENHVKSHNGMDIALLVFNHSTNILQFAGANRPLFLIRDGIIHKFSGDKMPVGNHIRKNMPFSNNTIQLQQNDIIYIFSDGYVDQFGEKAKRNFRTNQLKNLFIENFNTSLTIQKNVFINAFELWKGNAEQTDDILLIGIKPY